MSLRVRIFPLMLGMVLALVAAGPALAQSTGTITGQVFGTNEQPLPNVQVLVTQLDRSVGTDPDGRFTIENVPAGSYTIETRRLGYELSTTEVTVQSGQTATVEINMSIRAVSLDAVVVTGQGSEISRRRLSTNISVIDSEMLRTQPNARLDQVLQAGLPSVQVRMTSGQPGATSQMRGRGPVSASRSSTPVIYVDGVRVDNLNSQAEISMGQSTGTQTSAIADIPVENIERIEYIPGGAATTLYGSDAANGVLQIFTNRGSPGPAQMTFETELGVETPNKSLFHFPQTADLLYQNGLTQRHRISGRGGNEAVTYSFSGSVQDREGYRIANNASRQYQGRMGLTAQVRDDVTYDASFAYGWNHYDRNRDGNLGSYTPLWLLEGARIFALGFQSNLAEATSQELSDIQGFLDRAEALQHRQVRVQRVQTSHGLRWEPTQSLNFRALVGLDNRKSTEEAISTNEFLIHTRVVSEGTNNQGSIDRYERDFLGLTMEVGGQHRGDIGPFSVVTNAGGQLFRDQDQQAQLSADNVRDGSLTLRGAGVTTADDFYSSLVNYGVYAQQNWGYDDRYFVDVGLRADANSAFGDEIGFQYYPKFGLVWDLTAEDFFEFGTLGEWFTELRLRGNYGVAGNFPPAFSRDRTVTFNSYLGQQAVSFGNPGDPELGPEKTYTTEFGGDFAMLDGRLSLQANYYNARTTDALFAAPSPPSTGEGTQTRNVGEIENSGLELQFGAQLYQGANVTVGMNASYNTLNNKVVDSGGTSVFPIGGFSAGTVQSVIEEGQPVGVLRGNKATFAADGTIESVEAIAHLGNPLPDRFGTVGLDMGYGQNLTFNLSADWQTGAQMHSFNRQFRYLHGLDDPYIPDAMNEQSRGANWLRMTDQFVEDTDYLMFRNLSIRYSLPQQYAQRFADGIDVGFSVQNLGGWWSSSFNPESDHSGAQSQGAATVGGFNYASDPSPRTFLTTISVRF